LKISTASGEDLRCRTVLKTSSAFSPRSRLKVPIFFNETSGTAYQSCSVRALIVKSNSSSPVEQIWEEVHRYPSPTAPSRNFGRAMYCKSGRPASHRTCQTDGHSIPSVGISNDGLLRDACYGTACRVGLLTSQSNFRRS
jgi:hypothetical protein